MASVLLCLAHYPQAEGAAAVGRLDSLNWLWGMLHENRRYHFWKFGLLAASENGNREAVEWFLDHAQAERMDDIGEYTSLSDNLETIEMIWDRVGNKIRDIQHIFRSPSRSGSVCILKWLLDRGLILGNDLCQWAAVYGDIEALRFLHEKGCTWDSETFRMAVHHDHLDVLQWALSTGMDWNEEERLICINECPPGSPGLCRWIQECWPKGRAARQSAH